MAGNVISFPVRTAVDRAVLAADAKMTEHRTRPWMRPQQPQHFDVRARGLGLLAENDEPEPAADLFADAEIVALIQGQGYVGGLPA